MDKEYEKILQKANSNKKQIKRLVKSLSIQKTKQVDELIHPKHEKAFQHIDCLKCANCCKTTGPRFTRTDIKRIAKHINLSEFDFEAEYLRFDEDGDWVLKSVPCVFLEEDNKCSIYDIRPKACAEYPHTDRVDQKEILNITQKNTVVCPAVAMIFDEL